MMSHNQKSQPQPQAQDLADVQVSMAEEEAILPSNTPVAAEMASHSQNLQRASNALAVMAALPEGHEASPSNQGKDMEGAEHLEENAPSIKVADLVQFLLLKYQKKEPVTKAEIMESIIGNYPESYAEIFDEATKNMRLIFGIDMKVVDPPGSCYVLVIALGLTYDGMQSDSQGIPKTGLLILALGTIAFKGSPVCEKVMWSVLNLMGVYDMEDHYISGNPRKLITEDFVQEGYLRYRQVRYSYPAQYEFLWGPRAHAETSKNKVLKFLGNIGEHLPF